MKEMKFNDEDDRNLHQNLFNRELEVTVNLNHKNCLSLYGPHTSMGRP